MFSYSSLLSSTVALFAASTALAIPTGNSTFRARAPGYRPCKTSSSPRAGFPVADEQRIASGVAAAADPPNPVVLQVNWNVIYGAESNDQGYLPLDQIYQSIDILNSDYKELRISFGEPRINYVENQAWFNGADVHPTDENDETLLSKQMKEQLHSGDASTLNIYSVALSESGLLGFATFPWWYETAPKLDGVVLKWTTTPGGSEADYNLGKTLTHEVGHWLGLYHTFEGGCNELEGDQVADTPAQASATDGCPKSRNSCPGLPGNDPIHNFMDYSTDICLFDFTSGQHARMWSSYEVYRAGK